MSKPRLAIACVLLAGAASVASAHPVPRQFYDRTIEVRLAAGRVVVDYRLDVDVLTVYDDLGEFSKEIDLPSLTRPEQFCQAFNQCYAPILAGNIVARVDGKELSFRCVQKGHATRDENGQMLDHLRCELRFEAPWTAGPEEKHTFSFRESNYELATGRVRLALTSEPPVIMLRKTAPDAALQARPDTELRPGDAEKLRTVSTTFTVPGVRAASRPAAEPVAAPEPPAPPAAGPSLGLSAALTVIALAGLLFLGRQLRRMARS
jgi:hypothetical protein